MALHVTGELKEYPYWWEGTHLCAQPSVLSQTLPSSVDCVVVGAGLTGLTAAHTLAQAGREVLVLDAGQPGSGASSRNGGMLGRYFKHSFGQLMQSAGLETAISYFSELAEVYDFAVERIKRFGLDAGYRSCGRVVGAISQEHRDKLFREWELRARHIGEDVVFLERDDLEIGTARYVGGIHIVKNGCVHPGKYTESVLKLAEESGATIAGSSPVQSIQQEASGHFRIWTPAGQITARDVLVATNGHTPSSFPWFSRRLSPIKAFMVATEPLSADMMQRVRERRRTYHDNRQSSNYYQISEDGRLVMGGRTGLRHRSMRELAERMQPEIAYFFPELQSVRIDYAWTGRCAATADLFPHVGKHEGVHFALGYCFSGLAMAPYLGHKAAMRILDREDDARTLFTQDALKSVSWPARQEWLIPLAMRYFRAREPLPR